MKTRTYSLNGAINPNFSYMGIFRYDTEIIYKRRRFVYNKENVKKEEATMKFAFYTLGCKTNQYETQAMERLLTDLGHSLGHWDEDCDGYVINTCSVTAVADKKNRAVIRRCRKNHPNAILAVCGCYSQHAAEAVRQLGVDVLHPFS